MLRARKSGLLSSGRSVNPTTVKAIVIDAIGIALDPTRSTVIGGPTVRQAIALVFAFSRHIREIIDHIPSIRVAIARMALEIS